MSEELKSDKLSKVSAGEIFRLPDYWSVRTTDWEVVDDLTGEVLKRCDTKEQAIEGAQRLGQSFRQICWYDLCVKRHGKEFTDQHMRDEWGGYEYNKERASRLDS